VQAHDDGLANSKGPPVVKAWNAVLAETLEAGGKPAGTRGRLAIPVAGDDAKATWTVRPAIEMP